MGAEKSGVRVFGGTGVDAADGPVSIGGPRQRRLLALLVVRPEVVATNDWLAEHLWNDEDRPQATAPAIRTYMSRLRQAMPAEAQDWIETESSGYRWVGPPDAVEHRRFALLRAAATQAREREDPQAALSLLDDALGLWRGDPFRELEDLDWARAEIEQLRLDRLEMQEERWEAALALGRHTQITGELAAFTAEHRLRDRAARQYALALHRSGRTTEALRVIAGHRETLADESGLDPSSEIIELEAALLAGDASLDVEKVGRPLRGYRLLEEIGSGAFSVVWRGEQPSVNREVAIKQIRSDLASQPEFIRRFEAEAHLIARIEHPHIVPLIDYWRDPDSAYLVMRCLRGGTLERVLDDGPLSVARTLEVARQIGGALAAAHAQGVVHRDVKTSNIFLDEQQNAFLGDFGIALEAARSSGPEAALSPGSPAYASPEQIRQEPLDGSADVFSLGVVLYECLAGELPFPKSTSVAELVELQLNTPYPSLAELRSDVPAALSAAIAKATAKAAEDRFASIDGFLEALEGDPAGPLAGSTAAVVDASNPYKGLRAFDSSDAGSFFGRERLVSELIDRIDGTGVSSRCVAIVGSSGSGKSSVARAGLVPALRAGAVAGSDDWFVTTMTPQSDPYEALEAALLRIAVNPPPSLIEQLRSGPRGILRGLRRCLGSDIDQVLVLVDQFEELFTTTTPANADEFLDALAVAVAEPTSPMRLVVTLRADYYDRPLNHPTFAPIMKAATVQVTPLAADELERAIVEPARQTGVEFEAGLVARIAAEATGQPSPLPLLQFTLSALFDQRDGNRLTAAAYGEIGGLAGALTARAESIYLTADDAQRAAVRRIFGRMADPSSKSADLRRRVPLTDLDGDAAAAWVIENYGAARLLSFDRDDATREPTTEVAHEALLREWPRLVKWLAEDRDTLRTVDAIARAATIWEDGSRSPSDLYRGGRLETAADLALSAPERLSGLETEFIDASRAAADAERHHERRRVRRLRRLVAGTAIALVVALVAGGLALLAQRRADDEAARAVAAADRAELATIVSRSAALADDEPEVALLLALEAHRRAPGPDTEQAVFNALGSSAIPNRVASGPLAFAEGDSCLPGPGPGALLDYGIFEGQLATRDHLTGQVTTHGPSRLACAQWGGHEALDRRIVLDPSSQRAWLGPFEGPDEIEVDPDGVVGIGWFHTSHRLPVFGRDTVTLIDDRTGETVGDPISVDGGVFISFAADGDPGRGNFSRYAFSFVSREGSEIDGVTPIVDAETFEEIIRITTTDPLAHLAWDEASDELIAASADGSIVTFDAATGELLHAVEATSTDVLHLGLRPDGLVVVISPGGVEFLDRRAGPIGPPTELRNVRDARLRADGLVQVLTADLQIEVLDLGGNALINQTHQVGLFNNATIRDGLAGIVDLSTGNAEIIELATGERTPLELLTAEGDRFVAQRLIPETDGVWAISADNVFGRWVEGRVVEGIDLEGQARGRAFKFDRYASVTELSNGSRVAQLVNLVPGDLRLLATVPAPDAVSASPSPDDGLYVLDETGELHRYSSDGTLVTTIETGISGAGVLTIDPVSGQLAVGGNAVAIVDPTTNGVQSLPQTVLVSDLNFAKSGELIAVTGRDGTVRLWDLERGVSAGLAWRGVSAFSGFWSEHDPSADTMWVSASGNLLEIPLTPELWIDRACEVVARDLTEAEWQRLIPDGGPVRSACN